MASCGRTLVDQRFPRERMPREMQTSRSEGREVERPCLNRINGILGYNVRIKGAPSYTDRAEANAPTCGPTTLTQGTTYVGYALI